ncbi:MULTISPECIES: hypothetical protein [unclassified Novosphingobium]|uniref:hypothetical protein n=1 Tax=unclassified Novosphingobium TaxID=2644732 RepID=UPI000D318993|nr:MULTISPECIES: hypothetical protein [unclassified Novosphingobium]PTR12232.1 hypothetical protein C8K11_103154 [Novosphingobium sp. GV055]PUB05633.1 hypothetical protein C8K12_103154 [Novosphingobium sp. GV061]PUB21866.1 hypothetical protein C8K14_103154 [Novosphingobium sp. GV079]PUB43639.1 hypothetical protein C8K10_103154 [Novosphingobium sp. GV027]
MLVPRHALPLALLMAMGGALAGCHHDGTPDAAANGTTIGGDYRLEGKRTFRGMIGGNATVAAGADVTIAGMIGGDLIVEQGARVTVKGLVGGRIINNGGQVDVRGAMGGA